MTKVVMWSSLNGSLIGFTASGHAGFAEAGGDIVCAGISALLQTAALGLSEVLGCSCEVKQTSGLLSVRLPVSAWASRQRDSDLILRTISLGLRAIRQQFPEYLSVTVVRGGHV